MSDILTIVKKELYKYWVNKRTLFTVVLFPGLMIYVMYSLMGSFAGDAIKGMVGSPVVYAVNAPQTYVEAFKASGIEVRETGNKDEALNKVKSEDSSSAFIFDKSDRGINITAYYDSEKTASAGGLSTAQSIITDVSMQIAGVNVTVEDIGEKKTNPGMAIMVKMLPFLILMLLFSSSMSLAAESIAGERERGTFATLMMTPVKRTSIAYGKVISLSVMGILSGTVSFLGIVLSIPKLMAMGEDAELKIEISPAGYLVLFLDVILIVLLVMAVMALVSCLAKTAKEAGTMLSPFTIVGAMVGILSILENGAAVPVYKYFIPVYNNVLVMTGALDGKIDISGLLITAGVDIAVTVALVLSMGKMFKSEKFIFLS